MTPIVKKVFEQEKWEGDFRFKHMQIRVNSESLAFHGSSILEAGKTNQKLDALLRTQQQKFNRQYLLSLAVNFFDYIGSIASYLILSVPIFAGSYDHMNHADLAALISQNAFVCIYLIFSFSSLVDLSPKVVDIAGMTHRVAELVEELNHLKEHNPPSWRDGPSWPLLQSQASTSGASAPSVYDIVQLSVTAPSRSQLLIKDLDLTIKLRSNILIMGPSSCGKTSLLRTLRGLWTQNSGSLKCNLPVTPRHILFMPQRPFFTDGSLLDQVVYPLQDRGMGVQSYDESVMESLELVDLLPLVDRVGGLRTPVSWNWYEVLTPGEMQRLCFVRLFYHRPQLGLLDEVTSAISEDLEAVLFRRCRELGITLVTVGHRRSLRAHHDLILALDGRGGWTLESLRS
ncbi:unnamed protein product [Darwinula stevensoni]|uniref:ABC transporter domain-containing protein n=1 Tax=Darwinula stevensoni TaxID=69355 RepID=A0A7R9FRQ9_9CRUS|nr:unnamed protein product [Darwinula stevensoni]CAG0901950.1 unnamed protein product [Darwinula stevensoni]